MADEMLTGFLAGQADSNNGNNGGFGGTWEGIWGIIILAMVFGWGNGGWGGGFGGGGGANGALTRAELYDGFSMQNIDSAVRGVQQGICDSTYALNNAITGGFAGVNNAICSLGYQNADLINGVNSNINAIGTQLANCCCETQRLMERGFCDIGYNMATNTANIIQSSHNDTDRVIAKLDAMEMSRKDETIDQLRAQVNALNLAASQAAQNAFIQANQEAQTAELIRRCCPSPVPSYQVPAPYPYCNSGGCGCGCC